MDRVVTILSIILAFMSCSDRVGEWRFSPELQTARDLMQEQPDSALKFLIDFDDLCCGKASLAATEIIDETTEYQILVAEALYKNYYQQTNDSAVVAAAAYYDSIFDIYPENKDLAFQTARAHYYKAVGETEKDDIVSACEDYLKAVDIMEAAFPEIVKAAEKRNITDGHRVKARFIGLIYHRIGELFLMENCCRQSIENYFKSLKFCSSSDSVFKSISLKRLGGAYSLERKQDSALFYFRQSLCLCGDNIIIQSDVANQMALIYHDIGEKETAYNLLYKYAGKSMPTSITASNSYNLGTLNFNDLNYDSAAFYLEKSFADGNDIMRFSSAQMLGIIYDSIGDKLCASYYNKYALDNAVKEINRTAKTRDLENFYSSYKAKQSEEYHKKKSLLHISSAFLIALILSVPVVLSSRKRNKRLSDTVKKQENTVRNLETEKAKLEQKSSSSASLDRIHSGADINECLKKYTECPIGNTLRKRVSQKEISKKNICKNYDIALSDKEKILVRSSANTFIPSFTEILTDELGIRGDSVLLCCLVLLGFSISETAALMRVTYQSASRRVISIKEKLGTDSDIASFITKYMQDFYNK